MILLLREHGYIWNQETVEFILDNHERNKLVIALDVLDWLGSQDPPFVCDKTVNSHIFTSSVFMDMPTDEKWKYMEYFLR